MHHLPDELFAKILDLVPIQNVFADMRVSKRWEDVCRQAVRTRKSLILGDRISFCQYANPRKLRGWHRNRHRPSQQLDNITVKDEWLVFLMMKSLNQMENVKQFCSTEFHRQYVVPLIHKLANKLTLLEMESSISEIGIFPQLTHQHCWDFDPETTFAFPKLEELLIVEPTPHERLLEMRLPRLQRLMIDSGSYDDELMREFILTNSTTLESLHANEINLRFDHAVVFKNVTELKIWNMDEDMVKSFPAIRSLTVLGATTVALLSRLPAAQMLSLDVRFPFDYAGFIVEEEDEDDGEEGEKDGLDEFAAVISLMRNLKQLCIYDVVRSSPNARKDPTHALRQHVRQTSPAAKGIHRHLFREYCPQG